MFLYLILSVLHVFLGIAIVVLLVFSIKCFHPSKERMQTYLWFSTEIDTSTIILNIRYIHKTQYTRLTWSRCILHWSMFSGAGWSVLLAFFIEANKRLLYTSQRCDITKMKDKQICVWSQRWAPEIKEVTHNEEKTTQT